MEKIMTFKVKVKVSLRENFDEVLTPLGAKSEIAYIKDQLTKGIKTAIENAADNGLDAVFTIEIVE